MDLVITVKEIKGHCPTYKVGDSFTLKAGYQLVSDNPVCMHGLASLMPYYNALRVSEPAQWGLDGKEDKTKALIHCPDPCEYTNGGTVIFEISKVGQAANPSGPCG
ncbi:MAG: TIGR04076 family protein [Phycisphaerales bacterium]|jgi:uncharacterized repeat protein (TIGR04076 family)